MTSPKKCYQFSNSTVLFDVIGEFLRIIQVGRGADENAAISISLLDIWYVKVTVEWLFIHAV